MGKAIDRFAAAADLGAGLRVTRCPSRARTARGAMSGPAAS